MTPAPHRSKSCHSATSCLFSTSHRPEGDKQACCLIGNRCCEWEKGRQTKKERERERESARGRRQGEKSWTDIEMLDGKKRLVALSQSPNEIKMSATGFRSTASKRETILHVCQDILA